ncbi:MAG: hypothetical protein ACPHK8_00475 [Thermoplasmatota archaeon]
MKSTISVDPAVRDRLKTFGHAGMSHEQILTALMDRVQRESFVEELRQQYLTTPRESYVALEDL